MTAIHEHETGASAPALPAIADENDLFQPRTLKREQLVLPDLGKTILLEELTPKEYEEVNHSAIDYKDGTPKLDNRMWNARLIASSIRRPSGAKMYKADKDGQSWRDLATRVARSWSIQDVRTAAEKVADISGISRQSREAMETVVGNDSGESEISDETQTDG